MLFFAVGSVFFCGNKIEVFIKDFNLILVDFSKSTVVTISLLIIAYGREILRSFQALQADDGDEYRS